RYMPLDAEFADMFEDALDDRKIKLRRVLKDSDRLRYLYDFGDSWQHVIAVEAIEPCDFSGTWCKLLDGARACPPEDVGGVPGYQHFLQNIQLPDSDEGRNALEWAGGSFDAELFDRRAAAAAVQRICNNFWG
ncbi:plasmid pRiA4b ORF-3 family protein, partial [Pseudomonas aeruginosa]